MREFKSRVEENGEDQDGDPWEMRVCRGNVGQLLCTRENAEDFSEDEAWRSFPFY